MENTLHLMSYLTALVEAYEKLHTEGTLTCQDKVIIPKLKQIIHDN